MSGMLTNMDAAQIIDEYKRLPAEEQGKVMEFIRHQPNAETIEAINEPLEGLPRYSNMDEVKSAIKDLVHNA
jgi:hypothetical protein